VTEESGVSNKKGRTHIGRFYKWYLLAVILITVGIVAAMLVPKAVAAYGKYVGQTPQEAVQKYFEDKYPRYASDDAPLLVVEHDEFTVVVYDLSVQFGNPPGHVVYYQFVRHNLAGWYIDKSHIQGSHVSINEANRPLDPYILWNIDWGSYAAHPTLVLGKTVSNDVAYVEVDFYHSGQTERVAVRDGWFLMLQETRDWHEAIRVLDADGNVLEELVNDYPSPFALGG